jgi:hypothetical protein
MFEKLVFLIIRSPLFSLYQILITPKKTNNYPILESQMNPILAKTIQD